VLVPADNFYPLPKLRFAGHGKVTVMKSHLENILPSSLPDGAVAVNCIEQIENDVGFLRSAHRLEVAGGALYSTA
jgi:hypothetical protein